MRALAAEAEAEAEAEAGAEAEAAGWTSAGWSVLPLPSRLFPRGWGGGAGGEAEELAGRRGPSA